MLGNNTLQTKDMQYYLLLVPVGKVDQSNMFVFLEERLLNVRLSTFVFAILKNEDDITSSTIYKSKFVCSGLSVANTWRKSLTQ